MIVDPTPLRLDLDVRLIRRKPDEVDDAALPSGHPLVVLERQQHMGRAAAVSDHHRAVTGGVLGTAGILVELAT
jgi:hypothetical protein